MLNHEPNNIIIQNMKFLMVKIILGRLLHKGIIMNPFKKYKSFRYLTGNVDKKSRTYVAIRRKFRKKGRPERGFQEGFKKVSREFQEGLEVV